MCVTDALIALAEPAAAACGKLSLLLVNLSAVFSK
jgi:hypothetical protein